jgi:hypothetical protein
MSHFHYHRRRSIQTLTTLDLENNNIGDRGAQYLSNALQINTVSHSIRSSVIFHDQHIDPYHTESLV